MIGFLDAETIRKKFNTAAAREAFDRLHSLGEPRWVIEESAAQVYLAPDLHIKEGVCLSATGAALGASLDEVIIAQEKALKEQASKPGVRVVANAGIRPGRKEFTFDKQTDRFLPCAL